MVRVPRMVFGVPPQVNRVVRTILVAGLGAFVPLLAGCGTGSPLGSRQIDVWAVPASETVFPGQQPTSHADVYSEADKAVQLEAAINEIISFQLALKSSAGGTVAVNNIRLTDFRQGDATIPVNCIRVFRQVRSLIQDYPAWYLRLTPYLRAPREYPDVLVPLAAPKGALPILLEPDRAEAVWVDIHVPPGTEPGVYSGKVRVETSAATGQSMDVRLTVWPFAIPQTRHLPIIAGVDIAALLRGHLEVDGRPYSPSRLSGEDPYYDRAMIVVDAAMRLIHEHRASPVLWDLRPARRIQAGGQVELDWSDYDKLVSGTMDGSAFEDRAVASAWPLPIDERDPSPEAYGGIGSADYERFIAEYLRKCLSHFQQQGWLDRHFVWLPMPGGDRAAQYRSFERMAGILMRAEPRLRLTCPLSPMSLEPYGYLRDPFVDVSSLVGIWCPPPQEADSAALSRQRAAGKQVWLTAGRPPYTGSLSTIASPAEVEGIGWQAYRFGYDGVCLPLVNDWRSTGKVDAADSERQLLWPGRPYGLGGPVPSIRLKRLLRGAQDYEYLWLLDRNRRPAVAKLLSTDIFRYAGTDCFNEHFLDSRGPGWVTDPKVWASARRLMARELQTALRDQAGSAAAGRQEDGIRLEEQMEWSRLIAAVRKLQVTIEGVKARFDPQDKATPVHLEATVSFFNATARPMEGRVSWVSLPQGWKAEESARAIGPLQPTRGARAVVRAKANVVQPNTDGVVPIEVALQQSQGQPSVFKGRLCVLMSQRIGKPLVIDGRLEDWPLATNVASDFILVGAGDVPKIGRSSPDRPSQLTTVFACNDDDAIYLAFNCAENEMAGRVVTRSNYVRYDDLWPVGEDLVEIVLDPAGQAVGPGDLLHIVVKANGAVITEKGVQPLDRVAPVVNWASGITAAVDDQSQANCWTVELRIPLASLGKRGDVIGVNFARFDARRGEYSSWAAARSHIYSPITLGNMQLGR